MWFRVCVRERVNIDDKKQFAMSLFYNKNIMLHV